MRGVNALARIGTSRRTAALAVVEQQPEPPQSGAVRRVQKPKRAHAMQSIERPRLAEARYCEP